MDLHASGIPDTVVNAPDVLSLCILPEAAEGGTTSIIPILQMKIQCPRRTLSGEARTQTKPVWFHSLLLTTTVYST